MVDTLTGSALTALPPVPDNPLPYRRKLEAIRTFHTGMEMLRDAGGPVTKVALGPRWLMPPIVVATSPRAAHDILGGDHARVDKTLLHDEIRRVLGPNLFDLMREPWLPRRRALQPVFTRHHVREFGVHIAQSAETIAAGWRDGSVIDVDAESRLLTLRALGRSVLGLDLDEHVVDVAEPLRVATKYATDRAMRPVRAPAWLPTPARRRARAASATLHRLAGAILASCRADPGHDAPLVHALLAATDPATGRGLSDDEICDELVLFMLAGHDTTATTIAYSMWALGRHPDIQRRVAAEVAALGDRELTHDDVRALGYTVAVLHEALRLCPPGAGVTRVAVTDIEVDGKRVEAGSLLMVGIYALHRDPALWERPLEFDPDRFGAEHSKNRDRWQYLPFGAGQRSCIGDHFAMLNATLTLATIVRRVELHSQGSSFPIDVPFTTVASEPIPVRVTRRPRG